MGADGPSRVPCDDGAGWVPQPTSSSLTSSDHPESTGRSGGWPPPPPGALALLSGSEVVGGGDAAGDEHKNAGERDDDWLIDDAYTVGAWMCVVGLIIYAYVVVWFLK